jgi:hypothetical protein
VIRSNHPGAGWDRGRYAIERACDHRGHTAAACAPHNHWGMVASSDDVDDAHEAAIRLAPWGTYRVVDTYDGSVLT